MPNRILIDASHPEETRVVVTRGNRIEEFDFESQDKKQLRGNIYLARVTRVEPSLQAAFVEYGGNRHGFLAFSEIHPDYYQIPVADRQALLKAEAEAAAHEDDDENGESRQERERSGRRRRRGKNRHRNGDSQQSAGSEENISGDEEGAELHGHESSADDSASDSDDTTSHEHEEDNGSQTIAAGIAADVISEPIATESADPSAESDEEREHVERNGHVEEVPSGSGEERDVESVGAGDALDEVRDRRRPVRRHYKIQEVIKRRQILLVQVVKEERGNKGAALTTYLSLAGRYSVLMPNTARGGGISRKITSAQDRKRLKDVVKELEVPQGMGVILRTAGENRTKAEIKRDYEYLMRLWENVRNLTLKSTAPALVYEEGSLIKRSVRDLYNKDIEEILVSGDEGYREAKDFMRMLMPSHAKMVQPYRDATPIFARNGIEAQLDRMLQPQVTLKSGGYIIINQTEALVSIDVNSGRSTREHSIEDTAVQTNLEAAEEVARQLRLRDLAGLIVIDFIDMEESRNNRAVEKKLKECLKNDRARIQVGRISHFGLLEMSRQRIRASVLESTTKVCPHCGGTGHVRSDSSVALLVVRAIEEFLLKDGRHHITVRTPAVTALYVLNHKRSTLVELENRFGLTITIEADDSVGSQHYSITRGAVVENPIDQTERNRQPEIVEEEIEPVVAEEEDEPEESSASASAEESSSDDERKRKRKRRRRRRGGRDREQLESASDASVEEGSVSDDGSDDSDETEDSAPDSDSVAQPKQAVETEEKSDGKKRRRGKRGGKRNKLDTAADDQTADVEASEEAGEVSTASTPETVVEQEQVEASPATETPEPQEEKKPKPRARRTTKAKKEAESTASHEEAAIASAPETEAEAAPKPKARRTTRKKEPVAVEIAAEAQVVEATQPAEPAISSTLAGEQPESEEQAEPRKGWWQRKGFF
ncbi:MAG: Rne/Rng family ribonuclease [Rhizobiaceae bacterium]|nr:Rne/Rng family ribonuclease [Rhizobiaceae bacterium]